MRFMMLMIPLGYETAPPDVQLDPERVKAMMKYNEALKEAGVLIALDGLHPPSMGARVSFAAGKPVVTDGPFTEAKEVLGGYWMINVKSREEAIAWAKKCPASENEIIEIRQVQEMADFSEEVQQAAKGFDELQKGARTEGAVTPKEHPMSEHRYSSSPSSRQHQRKCGLDALSEAERRARSSRDAAWKAGSKSTRRRSSPWVARSARPRGRFKRYCRHRNEMGASVVRPARGRRETVREPPAFAIFPGERVEIMPVLRSGG